MTVGEEPPMADKSLVDDVKELVKSATLEEATRDVWSAFQKAIEELEETSRWILQGHFEGKTINVLAEELRMTVSEVEGCLRNSKKELTNHLRKQFQSRQ